jgi:hypothetical protein
MPISIMPIPVNFDYQKIIRQWKTHEVVSHIKKAYDTIYNYLFSEI